MKISFSFLAIVLLSWNIDLSEKFIVKTTIIEPIKPRSFLLRLEVTNVSDNTVSVLKNKSVDFKWPQIKSLGNYIVEMQRNENDSFQLFGPKADINPSIEEEEWIPLMKNETIIDTIDISFGYGHKGLPPGNYRVRVAFNTSRWSSSQENNSDWVNFTIQPDGSKK